MSSSVPPRGLSSRRGTPSVAVPDVTGLPSSDVGDTLWTRGDEDQRQADIGDDMADRYERTHGR